MASRQVGLRQRMANALRAAVAVWKGEVTPALNERVEPFLGEGEAEIDFSRLQEVLARMVAASLEELIEADKALIDELAGHGASRTRRDGAVATLRRKLVEIRSITIGLFGKERSREIVAVDGRIASQPDLLWRQGEHTLTRLMDPELELSESTTTAFRFDTGRLADELEPLVEDLHQAMSIVELERRQAEVTLAVKREAMADHDRLMGACGRILSGLHLLASRPDLAGQIRVTAPRRKAGSAGMSIVSQHDHRVDSDR